jgi:hypothetical protein
VTGTRVLTLAAGCIAGSGRTLAARFGSRRALAGRSLGTAAVGAGARRTVARRTVAVAGSPGRSPPGVAAGSLAGSGRATRTEARHHTGCSAGTAGRTAADRTDRRGSTLWRRVLGWGRKVKGELGVNGGGVDAEGCRQ